MSNIIASGVITLTWTEQLLQEHKLNKCIYVTQYMFWKRK
jgi:hypothetical protein